MESNLVSNDRKCHEVFSIKAFDCLETAETFKSFNSKNLMALQRSRRTKCESINLHVPWESTFIVQRLIYLIDNN